MFVLVYSNQDNDSKRFKTRRYYLLKIIIDSFNIIMNGKNFHDEAFGLDIKQYEEMRKLTMTQGEDYTTGCSLDYDCIRNLYRLIAVDLNRQRELDADPKAIQQIQFVGQLKNPDYAIVANESMFVLAILEKVKETRLPWLVN